MTLTGHGSWAPPASDPAPNRAATGGRGSASCSGIHYGRESEDSDSEEEDGRPSFAGGSTNSLAPIFWVQRRRRANNVGDFKASKMPEPCLWTSERGRAPRPATKAFMGGGSSWAVTRAQPGGGGHGSAGEAKPAGPRTFVLKMWKEGFSLDDGDIKTHHDDPSTEGLGRGDEGADS